MSDLSKKDRLEQLRKELQVLEDQSQYGYVMDDKCTVKDFMEIFKVVGTTFLLSVEQYENLSPETKKLFKLQ